MLKSGDQVPSLSARPIFGPALTLPADLAAGPLILHLCGSLASPFVRQGLALFQARFADLDRRGVRVVAISQSAVEAAQDFVPRHHLLFPLIADPDGSLSAPWGVQRDALLLRSARHLLLGGGLARLGDALGHGVGWTAGAVRQQGATFLLGRDGTVRYAHYAAGISEPPPVEALVLCVASL